MASTRSKATYLFFLLITYACLNAGSGFAQSDSARTEAVRGIVLNSVTGEPISRALVHSADNRFAMMTNSEGRFEFAVEKAPSSGNDSDSKKGGGEGGPTSVLNGPNMLIALKPGYLPDPGNARPVSEGNGNKEWTLRLIPEALIVGTVTLPSAEPPDSVTLQLFRREVQDGSARYIPAGIAQSRSDGGFRFVDLQAGSYKLLTMELLDGDPTTMEPGGPIFGYPPVFYPNAPDFASSATIEVTAGQTQNVNVTLVRQRYYNVKIPLVSAGNANLENGIGVDVYTQGRKGPGYTLGFNPGDHAIEGLLPNGVYTVDAATYGRMNESGTQTISIKGAAANGSRMTLAPSGTIVVNVAEEFTSGRRGPFTTVTGGGKTVEVKGPRRYLNVSLVPADDSGAGRMAFLRDSIENPDGPLLIDAPSPGSYWVRINTSFGYAASVRSGNVDLLRQPLMVGAGGTGSIEITMRDDSAELSGTVEGVAKKDTENSGAAGGGFYAGRDLGQTGPRVYCIPLADSAGQYAETGVAADGSFDFAALAPGEYRVLVLDGSHEEIEYRNPEAMRAYDSKGTVVHLSGGQKERITMTLGTPEGNS